MEQIAKEIARKQYPQSIQVIHQTLPVHDGFLLIYQYLWNASAKIYYTNIKLFLYLYLPVFNT